MSVGLTNTAIKLLGVYPFEVSERLILVLLAWRADENGETRMTKTELARQSGLSQPTVRKATARLEMMGLVSGKQMTLGVRALVRLLDQSEEWNGQETEGKTVCKKTENGLQSAKNCKMENGFQFCEGENGKQFTISTKTKTENSFPSKQKTLFRKTENGLLPYRQDYKTRSTACAREGEPSASEGDAPKGDGQAEVLAVSPATGRAEPVLVRGWEALRAFRGAYPKPPRDVQALNREWALLEHEGVDGHAVTLEELLGALAEAKLSKQWQEDGGRFVPRPEVWLGEQQFVPLLQAARERRAAGKTQAEREAEETARAKEAAEATGWLVDEEI